MDPERRERYSRQILFAGIGEAGQENCSGRVALVGCGALGTVTANLLARAGIGRLRIIDRDFVETSNLQRQTLFEESDAQHRSLRPWPPSGDCAPRIPASRLKACGGSLAENALELLSGFSLLLDGTDNFETRLLLNDAAISLGVPWIYAAAVGSYGITMTILPGKLPASLVSSKTA